MSGRTWQLTASGRPARTALANHPVANSARGLIIDKRGTSAAPAKPCTNQFTNHMQKALSLFEKGPLALVAGGGFGMLTVAAPSGTGGILAAITDGGGGADMSAQVAGDLRVEPGLDGRYRYRAE
jgi:hypothetical protein